MANNYIGLFDVIGPIMVGPSSSHTSGAATIAWMASQIFSGTPVKVDFRLYGSFAETYKGHGTDRALIGGMLGFKSDDVRIRNAYKHAREKRLKVEFAVDKKTSVSHPNTVDILITGDDGHTLLIRGESIGGGRVRIRRLNGIEVDFNGEYSTMIIGHQDVTGTVAYITSCLAEEAVRAGKRPGILATDETAPLYRTGEVRSIGRRSDEASVAHNLFAVLREFDSIGVDIIYSEAFPEDENLQLYLMGTGGEWIHPEKKNITCLGSLEEETAHRFVSLCDVGLIPYDETRLYYHLAYPTKLSFYLTAGIPFLSTPVEEIRRAVEGLDGGWLAPVSEWEKRIRSLSREEIGGKRENVLRRQSAFFWETILDRNRWIH